MATHPGGGRELIDELIATRRDAQRLLISLRFQGRDKEADKVEEKTRELTEQIDALLTGAIVSWEGQAERLTERLAHINRALASDVARIRKRAANEQSIANALGHLEEAVSLLRFRKR